MEIHMASYFGNKPLIKAVIVILAVISTAAGLPSSGYEVEEPMKGRFQEWMAEHNRTYKDEAEKAQRFQVFKANADFVDGSNAAGNQYNLATNEFADMTNDEFVSMFTGLEEPNELSKGREMLQVTLDLSEGVPESVDWRANGAVTDVKNQGKFASCWAFSVVAAVEGIHQITNGELLSLSEQQVLDCSKTIFKGGKGGRLKNGFRYIMDKGITTQDAYPYVAAKRACRSGVQPATKIRNYRSLPATNEKQLARVVANQPVSVALHASRAFQLYKGGVLTSGGCKGQVNHAVTVVGYGKVAEDGTKFWLVKNSWGKKWGEEGYIKLERDTRTCGVAKFAFVPIA
ncbi:Ananain [Dichanthelium oligosanthes]|uniref:Ananain n=1 Tax=Dichanthelium oligosanthes TaxID=888268 RepID=A0A1E5UV15_9POAL|nr:Ananain [Dichanthelium oligosanthes]